MFLDTDWYVWARAVMQNLIGWWFKPHAKFKALQLDSDNSTIGWISWMICSMSIALSLEITLINCELYCESPENRRTARGSGWRHKCCSWTGFLTIRSLSQLHHSLWDLGTCEFTLLQLRNGDNSAFLCGSVLLRFHQPCRDWQCVFWRSRSFWTKNNSKPESPSVIDFWWLISRVASSKKPLDESGFQISRLDPSLCPSGRSSMPK